jgi:hypothetical protein
MSKTERVLGQFPAFYQALEPYKLLHGVVRALAQPLEEADTHLFRIQRAHRIKVAEQAEDLIELSKALNLDRFIYEDLLEDPSLGYAEKLEWMRARAKRIAQIHLNGLGTPWAILEMAAIFLDAEIVRDTTDSPLIWHIDPSRFSHRATIEFGRLSEKPRARLYLHENPFRRKKIDIADRWPLNHWTVENTGSEPSPIRFVIRGEQDRTVLPGVFSPDASQGFAFNGIVPSGSTLVIDAEDGATLDGEPVDDWVAFYQGGFYDFDAWDRETFLYEQPADLQPLNSQNEEIISQPLRRKKNVPQLPLGRSEWVFTVPHGVWNGSRFDFAVYFTQTYAIGLYDQESRFDGCVFAYPSNGAVGMAWDERIGCAFKLVLPPKGSPEPPGGGDQPAENRTAGSGPPVPEALDRIAALLPRFKAAGVRAFIDRGQDAWILGESILRSAEAQETEGIQIHATKLQDERIDQIIV